MHPSPMLVLPKATSFSFRQHFGQGRCVLARARAHMRPFPPPTSALLSARAEGAGTGRLAVVALGGNALQKRDEPVTVDLQMKNARDAAQSLAALVHGDGVHLCVTHGNGPQVGRLAEQDPRTSLAVLGAESQGQIGFLLADALAETLPELQLAVLLTQVEVDPTDPAFQSPTKFIGPEYSEQEALALEREKGYAMAADGSSGWRRVVASPAPQKIVEVRAIEVLLKNGVTVICTGGGGIPVVLEDAPRGGKRRCGIEAVIDKDAASALLAKLVDADMLLLLTDAPHVYDPRRWPSEKVPLRSPITPDELERYEFAGGSMKPKIAAAVDFVRSTGRPCGIGALHDALDVVRGKAGTWIVAEHEQ